MTEECKHGMDNPSWCGSCKQREEARRKGVTTYPSKPPVDPETEIALREIIEEQRRSQHVGNPEEYPLDERFPVDIINMVTKDHETREAPEEEGRLGYGIADRSTVGFQTLT